MTIQLTGSGNVPSTLTTFVGRRRELDEVCSRLGTARLLTLTGAGGVGKTRLALETAGASSEDFADGVWLVDLTAVRNPSLVANATAAALGVPDLGVRPIGDQLTAFLAHRAPLIVLDNCEHLVDACAELVHALLSASPGLRILTTSRRALGICGEHVFTVPPLAPDEAVQLLSERTCAIRPEFRITDDNRAQVFRLCDDLDGLPLAIELAASRLRTLTVHELVNRLEDRFGLLRGGNRAARPHQRTLRGLIDWSHELCTPAERQLWHRLSVFADDFALESAEAVCAGDGIGRHDVLDLLDQLVEQSIVLPTTCKGMPRYRLLETIRQYGRARLAESGGEQRTRRRHHAFYLALAARVADGWYGPGQLESLALMRAEHANLRVALDHGGDPQATLALATALRFHWCEGGFLGEGRRWLDQALAAAPEPVLERARASWVAAWVAALQHDHAAAYRWLDEAAELGERLDDPVVCAYAVSLRGTLALFNGWLDEAMSFFEAAVAAHLEAGEEIGAVYALLQLGTVQSHLRDPRATRSCRQAVALAEAHGERLAHGHALWTLGYDAWLRGDLEQAWTQIRSALEKEQGFNDFLRVALMLEELAWVTAARGDREEAGRLLGAAGTLWRDTDTTIAAFGPHMVEQHTRCEEEIVKGLGQAVYEKTLAEGAGHRGPDHAIAYALRIRPESTVTVPARTESDSPATVPSPNPLTPREREVAALVAKGMSNQQIASALGRSRRTADRHVENILAKLSFTCRAQIASWWTANQAATP